MTGSAPPRLLVLRLACFAGCRFGRRAALVVLPRLPRVRSALWEPAATTSRCVRDGRPRGFDSLTPRG
jgi:hypothetical protein